MTEEKTNKISIYLLKDNVDIDNILKKEYLKLDLEKGIFYYDKSPSYAPSWINSFFNSNLENVDLFNQSSKGIYFTKIKIDSEEKTFAIPFGYGHTMIEKMHCVDNFGLKLLLNIVDRESIRKIGKRTLSSDPKNTVEQLSKIGAISDFGIDIEQDLIEEITGIPKYQDEFGDNLVTGKTAFTISAKVNIENVDDFLKTCFEYYEKEDYKEDFAFIDQVQEIKDTETLDNKLIEKFKDNTIENVQLWMAIPEIIEWEDVAGFSFKGKKENLVNDISLEDFRNSLSENQIERLDLEFLKRRKITAFKNSTDDEYTSWAAFQCIYCEITESDKRVILTNGKWYEVAKDFVDEVEKNYSAIISSSSTVTLLGANKKEHEDKYNDRLATSLTNSVLMDRKNIRYGGGASAIEFCDVYDADKKTFIHVKNYYGSSALSHLFAQGRVSGQLFLNDEPFRKKAKEKETTLPFNPTDIPIATDYKIIFGVISESSNELNLPFFSKVNFKNEKKLLEAFGFKDIYLIKICRS